ncbi:EAL domain-containing protein [Parvularcula dongshanensis]|uniref:Diguanylate cyclase (GGDEF)-like protein n=1 Tax=Parvularcula dongshanensis TaxID=1173995 RepID=A0A840I1Q9_9PROT|nr:EAL domain-containing protein [Parvularcula dongshanensis]MBB4658221.1 diguanylate cyclase (GGDEF)-like protein [Parvularcula dongshanensis]
MKDAQAVGPDTVRFALEAAGQAMFEYDAGAEGALRWADPSGAEAVLGGSTLTDYSVFSDLLNPEDALRREAAVQEARASGGSYAVEYALYPRDETGRNLAPRWVEERGTWMQFGATERLIAVVRRIDEQKKREARLSYLAAYDDLTGALNRARIKEELKDALKEAHDGSSIAYLLVGIDDVGAINAGFGFDVADQVIIAVAERLSGVVGERGLCGRVAGTKFGVILRLGEGETVRERAVAILNAMRESVVSTSAGGVAVSVCVGAATLGTEVESAEAAMGMTDAAFDAARQTGPSSWSAFSERTEMTSARRRNTEMSDVILTALNQRRVYLAYQPIVTDLTEGPNAYTKYECLIRMRGDNGEEIPAPAFIPAAERLGLVHLLDRRVLELATEALVKAPGIALNVNISWETVKDPLWAEGYIAHLRANRHLADRLTVELTETQAVDAIEASVEFVSEIKSLGCRFAIDDFGAGYTSFRNLKALDIDVLKIDGSFVTGVSSSRENQLFVRTLLDLARNFEMKTVAEWVDNETDAMLLKGLGVDYLQGFLIGKPEAHPEWSADLRQAPGARAAS